MTIIKRIFRKIRRHTFPTILDRWWLDKGDETLRLDYPLDSNSLVLDFGGYEGSWAAAIHERYACNVLIFEPVPEYAIKIKERFHGNSKIEVFQFGLGENEREETIKMSCDGSSIFLDLGISIAIQIKDADKWFQERGYPSIELAKLNIEGGEYELLEKIIKGGYISNIRNIQIQFHSFIPDSLTRRKQIQASLSDTHELQWCYDFVWENWSLK